MEVYSCLKIQDLSSWLKAAGKALPMNIMVHTGTNLWDFRQETTLEISNSEQEITGRKK